MGYIDSNEDSVFMFLYYHLESWYVYSEAIDQTQTLSLPYTPFDIIRKTGIVVYGKERHLLKFFNTGRCG